jgi:putative FmdB family regulatory protein
MPTYEFTCIDCDKTITATMKYDDIDTFTCTECGNAMNRSYSFGAVSFKGSGFYTTDKGKQ